MWKDVETLIVLFICPFWFLASGWPGRGLLVVVRVVPFPVLLLVADPAPFRAKDGNSGVGFLIDSTFLKLFLFSLPFFRSFATCCQPNVLFYFILLFRNSVKKYGL